MILYLHLSFRLNNYRFNYFRYYSSFPHISPLTGYKFNEKYPSGFQDVLCENIFPTYVYSYSSFLTAKQFKFVGAIYGVYCPPVGYLYAGSTVDLRTRVMEHLRVYDVRYMRNAKTDVELQIDVYDHGVNTFQVIVFEILSKNTQVLKNTDTIKYTAFKQLLKQREQVYFDLLGSHGILYNGNLNCSQPGLFVPNPFRPFRPNHPHSPLRGPHPRKLYH